MALGALVNGGSCLSSGGILIQPLPDCPESVISELELRSMLFSSISREVADMSLDDLYLRWFDGLSPKLLLRQAVRYRCDCSRDRMERALISMGKKELQSLIDEDGHAELTCHFCRSTQTFDKQQLIDLLERAQRD